MELYVHIPFCRSKCRYCDFASYAGQEHRMSAYVDALLSEAQAEATQDAAIETVFIGGGTPSLLPAELLDRLLDGLQRIFRIPSGIEFTSEANPGTLTASWLDTAVRHSVNRLSMGMQAYQPELLHTLGRIHDFAQVQESVELARQAGIGNLSLDLMFGLPGQTPSMWRETLHAALSLRPQHLSCYGLIPEEGTPFMADLAAGRLTLPSDDEERTMYEDAIAILAQHGFLQYEISNFSLPGYACRHNLGYWRQVPYLGLGASASSMLPDQQTAYRRQTNPPHLDAYLTMVNTGAWNQRETALISPQEAQFETLMLGLRTIQGVSEAAFQAMHGMSLAQRYGQQLQSLAQRGFLLHEDGWWRLTRRGMDVQNAVLVELMDD